MKIQCDKCLEVFSESQISHTEEGAICLGCQAKDPSALIEVPATPSHVLPTPKPEPEPAPVEAEAAPEEIKKEEEAKKELANRELCRRHLIPFIRRFKPAYKVGWVHKVFAAKLEKFLDDVINEREPRLIVQVPPRHGKSEIISNNFPSWILGKYPEMEIIMASHTLSLPIEFSRENRDRMLDERYKNIFPNSKVDPKTTSSERWRTLSKGGIKCAGVGGAIGGFGAHILIIDDPIKDYEDAQSETIREVAKNWYTSTAENRLAPGGGVIIVMTRWSDDDLAGARLRTAKELQEQGVPEEEIEKWDVVSFPAISEDDEYLTPDLRMVDIPEPGSFHMRGPDEALHPARYPLRVLKRKRAGMPSQQWSALFQQKPVPDSGDFFTKDDFVFYDQVPEFHHYPILFAWDLAVGEKQYNDYTVGLAGLVVPVGGLNHIYLLDHYRKRVRDKEQIDAMVNMYLSYKENAARIGLEYGQIFLAIERRLIAAFREKSISPPLDRELKPVRDKRVRATPARGWMQHHRIHFPKHQPWVQGVMDELLRFDAGVHDDNVDALAWLVRMAEKMPVITSMREKRNREKTTKDKIEDLYRKQQLRGTTSTGYMTS